MTESEDTKLAKRIALQQIGLIYLHNRLYSSALPYLEKALKAGELTYRLSSKVQQEDQMLDLATLLFVLARTYYGCKEYDDADLAITKCLNILADHPKKSSKLIKAHVLNAKVINGRIMLMTNSTKNEGIQLLESVVKENDNHIAGLTYYAQIAIEMGKSKEVIPYLLRAIVQIQQLKSNKDKENLTIIDDETKNLVCLMFTQQINKEGALATLFSDMGENASTPSALVFLAQTVKDYSGNTGLGACLSLYARAAGSSLEADVEKVHIVLDYVHSLEVAYQYDTAFSTVRDFLGKNRKKTIGTGFSVEPFYEIIKSIPSINDQAMKMNTADYTTPYSEIPPIYDEGKDQLPLDATPQKNGFKRPYPDHELNLLALLFTCVKVLFLHGAIQPLPALINLLEPLRVGKELHLTVIRNENAYYATIAQLCRTIPFPMRETLLTNNNDTIYVCADSHSLSSAWQYMNVKGKEYLLRPKLVTGTKCWHMRDDCHFFTHANWLNAKDSIPTGSKVIFNFGEIDCREGLLVAVEKCKYENVQQGIESQDTTHPHIHTQTSTTLRFLSCHLVCPCSRLVFVANNGF